MTSRFSRGIGFFSDFGSKESETFVSTTGFSCVCLPIQMYFLPSCLQPELVPTLRKSRWRLFSPLTKPSSFFRKVELDQNLSGTRVDWRFPRGLWARHQEQQKDSMTVLTVEFKNDYVLGFIICEIVTVITLQDWVGWGIFTVIPGYPWRASGESLHLEARPELQDWLRFELFTVKNYRTGPFSK